MNVLITGASGFVGRVLCETLLKSGYHVRGVYRDCSRVDARMQPVLVSEINAHTNWAESLLGVDVIVHLAARVHVMNDTAVNPLEEFRNINVEGTLNLARQAAKAGVKRFVFVSSVKVNGELTEIDKPFSEDDVACPQDAYGLSKFEAEQGLLQVAKITHMDVVIIRPPLVYGAGVKANFAKLLLAVKNGVPLPLGSIVNKRSFIYVENLTSFILRCTNHPRATNQIFLVSDGDDISTSELLRMSAQLLDVKSHIFSVPQKTIEFIAKLLGKQDMAQRLLGNLQVDITKSYQLLEWKPPFTIKDGLNKTVTGLNQR